MLDIDWHGHSYRSLPQLSLLSDSLQPLLKFNGGDAGQGLYGALASSRHLNMRNKTPCDGNKIKTDPVVR